MVDYKCCANIGRPKALTGRVFPNGEGVFPTGAVHFGGTGFFSPCGCSNCVLQLTTGGFWFPNGDSRFTRLSDS